ncbi:class I SAM-dependent methyltransferase [Marinobacterium jannaschii]|uniref:class I SAM-dependent methyltransferase n=1 Tax=Marinobacterium jannaschii TaxID=64970 RepID=UPI00047F6FE5|nr:class I SAM-dependent methyltransferase [Marinobacterium jannaschii]
MAYSIGFWNRIAPRYARQPVADQAAYEEKLAITRSYLRPEMQVLEFACGTGSTALLHAPLVARYRATDLSPKMIEIAEAKRAQTALDNLTFEAAPLQQLDIEPQSLDAVLGMSILHLLDDRDAAIRQVYDMLKPGGLFFSSTACIADFMPWFRLIAPLGSFLRLIPRVSIFSQLALENSLTAAGFTIEQRFKPESASASVFLVARKPD